jgi:hypothetical protein
VESGDLATDYPESKDLKVHFEIVFKHDLPESAKNFLAKAKNFLKTIEINLDFQGKK